MKSLKTSFFLMFFLFLSAQPSIAQASPNATSATTSKDINSYQDYYMAKRIGLSFEQVKAILNSDKIYEGRINPKDFYYNHIVSGYHCFNQNCPTTWKHPYRLSMQAIAVCFSNTTDSEKEKLWNLLLYRNMAIAHIYIMNGKITEKIEVNTLTPKKLSAEMFKYPGLWEQIRTDDSWLIMGGCAGAISSFVLIENFFNKLDLRNLIGVDRANADGLALFFGFFVGVYLTFKTLSKLTLNSKFNYTREKTLELVAEHKERIVALASTANTFPAHFIEDLANLEKELSDLMVNENTSSSPEAFTEYLAIVEDYYDRLAKEAGIPETDQ